MKERYNSNDDDEDDSAIFASCDWRLSRAAREILRVHLEHAWRQEIFDGHSSSAYEKRQFQHHTDNLWQLLEESLAISTHQHQLSSEFSSDAAMNGNLHHSCPLLPERDAMGRYLEETIVQRVDAGQLLFKKTRQSSLPGAMVRESKPRDTPSSMYHCGLCHKNFTSRYYLDRHLHNKHGDHLEQVARDFRSTTSSTTNSLVPPLQLLCPAQHWCHQFLSHRDCHQAALELEPYYGPGSAGRSSVDRDVVFRQRIRESVSPPNSEDCVTTADRTLAACHDMIRQCFWGGEATTTTTTSTPNIDRNVEEHSWNRHRIGRHLNATLCVPQHSSCPGRQLVHDLLSSTSSSSATSRQRTHRRVVATMLHPDDVPNDQTWQDVWHAEEEQLGVLVVLIFIGIVFFYGYRCLSPASSSTTCTTATRATDRSYVASNKESIMRHSNPEDQARQKQRSIHPRDKNLPPVDRPSTHVKQN